MNLLNKDKVKIASERYNICFSCDNLDNDKCKLCGCNMSKKVYSMDSKCKEGKW